MNGITRVSDVARRCSINAQIHMSDDKPTDPREQDVRSRSHVPVPTHLVVKAIKDAAVERVQAYRKAKDYGRLSARNYLRKIVDEYSVEEVQTWLDECRADRGRR